MQSQGAQASPHVSSLEDRQIIQIVIDNQTNGNEFEFSEEILAKEIRIKGFLFYCTNLNNINHRAARGSVGLQLDWLKVSGVRNNVDVYTNEVTKKQYSTLFFPWDFRADQFPSTTFNYNMDLPISLPSQTSMRKRFKATVVVQNPFTDEIPMHQHAGLSNELFRFVLTLEVVHDHIFR